MTAVAFDTLKFARSLREKAKLSSEQAEGLADAFTELFQGDIATKSDIGSGKVDIEAFGLSTRADVESLRLSTQADIKALSLSTQADIEALRLSTRADIEALKLSTRSDLREAEARLEAKIEATKVDIIKWMFGTIGFQTLIILGAVIALARIVR
ncbi:DUF1640 domain-containing protein [Methylobacterium bullatum]|uniref:DUF1640 domain-containing protein n=1 Tax=Methylobacterium bullatum TaxID=570505 RepID=A0A679JRZ1_9HYPH|nr:hypothetical protein MBLL_02659 [Methylobacterium bullatum]